MLAFRRQPLHLAAKRNHPLGNFFCHVDNFGNNPPERAVSVRAGVRVGH